MQTSKVDISVNITAHEEGILLHKTLRSIFAGIQNAIKAGITIELNLSLDNANDETKRVASRFLKSQNLINCRIFEIDVKDLGLSRNYLIEKSNGKYISFFDGDDLFTSNYLKAAYEIAEKNTKPCIYSAEYIINFEADHYIIKKLESNDINFRSVNLFETNYFISQNFVHSDIYKNVIYRPNSDGYGMEDWHWNTEVTAAGYEFVNVPQTIFFYRRKKIGSLLTGQVNSSAVIRESELFKPEVFSKLKAPRVRRPLEVEELVDSPPERDSLRKILRANKAYKYAKLQYGFHRQIFRSFEKRKKESSFMVEEDLSRLPKGKLPNRMVEIGFSDSLLSLWGEINQYEPMIRASFDQPLYIPILEYPQESEVSRQYYNFCRKFKNQKIKDIVIVPHLVPGGADKAAISLIRKLAASNDGATLVITSIDVESPWMNKVDKIKNVICIESKYWFNHISDDLKQLFILRIVQNWRVERLSIINSELGYKLVTKYNKVFKNLKCKTYLHTYAFDMTEDGYLFNYINNGLVDAYTGVDYYITDSVGYKTQLETINGFDPDKVKSLYLPVANDIKPKKQYKKTHKILWASRIHNAKLVEVVVEVGSILAKSDIELHMFGDIGDEYKAQDKFVRMIKPYENIVYHGAYDGFSSINTDDYDMFLMTSKNEGMPNVILEAAMANIFIIAPAVGGIPETVSHGINGLIVQNKFDAHAYADAILSAYQEGTYKKKSAISKINYEVLLRHTDAEYDNAVNEIMGLRVT